MVYNRDLGETGLRKNEEGAIMLKLKLGNKVSMYYGLFTTRTFVAICLLLVLCNEDKYNVGICICFV